MCVKRKKIIQLQEPERKSRLDNSRHISGRDQIDLSKQPDK